MFSNKLLVIRAGIHKQLVRIGYREDPDQTASGSALFALVFWQATSVRNFRIFIVNSIIIGKRLKAEYFQNS